MKIKIKRLHENSIIPSYAKPGDAGLDLTATSKNYDEFGNVSYGTGLSFKIPEGFVGLLFPRSSNSKQSLILSNSVGILDSGYIGEVLFKFKPSTTYSENIASNFYETTHDYQIGDRVGQLLIIPYPQIEFEEVNELEQTVRGDGGFGSTGR